LALLLIAPVFAQQRQPAPPGAVEQEPTQTAQQPLDLQEAAAADVLEPLRAGIEGRNWKQILSVFDPATVPDFPNLRDRIRAFLDAYTAFQFRYKILQASSDGHHASMICEFDLDATPLDEGKVSARRSTQMRLQLTLTPKGWRISAFAPADFFAQ
jgi:hypothetical protein